jgi:hypothetical protein
MFIALTPRHAPITAVAALVLSLVANAQDPVVLPPAQTATVAVQTASPNDGPHVPPPPRAIGHQGPSKVFTPVPPGTGTLPQPNSPPTQVLGAGGIGPAAPCDLRFFMNNAVAPTGALLSASTGEPNVAVHGDGVLYAGNFFAARSSDSGMSWARYDPSAFFPASDGGFCCDQRTLFVRNPDMMIWLLEYSYSATTQQGRLRVAFTRTQADLKNDNFFYFDLAPGTFGQPAGRFLDYSDIAYSNGFLYGSAIIASPPATAQGLVLWRASLFDIWDLGNVGLSYYTSATLGGFGSYRFAQGASNPMYWAAHTSTTNLRVFSWADAAGAASQFDRTVAAWSGTPTAAAGPDGRDWTGFGYTVNTVLSGYVRTGEVGFLWTSGSVANRPQTFVRVARLRTSDLAVIGQDDIWNATIAWHFPTCAVNAAGEVGGTIAFGGGGASGFYPSAGVFLVDQCSPNWAPLANAAFAVGARGPASNRWGDYLGAGRHSVVTTTFVGAGFSLDSAGSSTPRFVWFGRERDEPAWVDVNVVAFDTTGATALLASMTVAQTDRAGRKDGVTPFARSYPPRQALTITAPVFAQSAGGAQHQFEHWVYEGVMQPVGQRTLSVGDIGTGPRTVTARAVYAPAGANEVGDAGAVPAAAQAPQGTGRLPAISGAVAVSGDIDYYLIHIVDEANFSASTIGAGPTLADTQLFLFDASGAGVVCNDDEAGGSTRSRIDSTHVTSNGTYFLAVSGYNRDPTNNDQPIFPNTFTGQIQPTPGRGPANGTTTATSGTGTYVIQLTGCEFAPASHAEAGDAGELPQFAQTPCKVGPLNKITGALGASDVDMFKIQIDSPAAFSASCCANTAFDSQLFLFADSGLGVVCNDDNCGTNSRLDNTLVTAPGVYYLAISQYNRDPGSLGGLIFPNTFTGQQGPTGPGGAFPVNGWSGSTAGAVTYEILLTGCSFASAAAGVDYGTGAGSAPGVPSLTTTFPPQMGNSTGLTLTNPDATARGLGLLLGQARASIPFLHGQLLVGDIALVLSLPAPALGATSIGPFSIPNVASMCGQRVTWQAIIAVVPTGGFPHGLTLTNGTEWTFGL